MNCDGVRGLLSAYLDGELSPGELLRVEQHLRRCHACSDEVDSLRQVIALVASLDEVEVPATFHQSLHERLVALGPPAGVGRPKAAPAWQRHMRRWVLPAAAAAAAVTVGLTGIHRAGNMPSIEPASNGPVAYEPAPARSTSPIKTPSDSVKPIGNETAQPPAEKSAAPSDSPAPSPAIGEVAYSAPIHVTEAPSATGGGAQSSPIQKPPAALGPVGSDLSTAYSASFRENVTPVEALPSQFAYTYTLSASVADPSAAADALAKKYSGASEVTPVGSGKAVLRVIIKVPAKEAVAQLANIKAVLGQTLTEEEPVRMDLSQQLKEAYQSLELLDARRAQQQKALTGVTDQALVETAWNELAEMTVQASEAKANIANLGKQVSTSTIIVNLAR